jgi:hypothetical protein
LLPYLILYGLFAVAAIKSAFDPVAGRNGKLWSFLAAAILIIVVGLRYQVGGDWWNYTYILQYIGLGGVRAALFGTQEPGYGFLNWIAAQEGWGIWFPNLVCATIFTWGLLAFIRRQPNPSLGLVIAVPYLIIIVGMGYTRQSAALGFIFLALVQLSRGATLRMAICLLLAAAFHRSSIVVLPLLAFAVSRRGVLSGLAIIIFGAVLAYELSTGIKLLVANYTNGAYTSGGAIPRVSMNVLPALIFLGFRRRFAHTPEELRLWTVFSLAALLTVFLLFLVASSAVADRVSIYLIPLQLFVLPRVPVVFGRNSRTNTFFVVALLVYSAAVELVWLNFGTWSHGWLPYQNYLWHPAPGKTPPRGYVRELRQL